MKQLLTKKSVTLTIECYTHGDSYEDYSRVQVKNVDTGEVFWMWRQPFDHMKLNPGDKFMLVNGIAIKPLKTIDLEI